MDNLGKYKFDNIDIKFKNHDVLKNANLVLSQSNFYCLIGKNGSGKSSLLGYIKNNYSKKYKIRVFPQQLNTITYNLTVFQYLKSFCLYEKILNWKTELVEYLEEFNLTNKKQQILSSLSGGERQRVFLAQVILADSDIVFLDEPFSNLDIDYKLRYYECFKKLAVNKNIPIVVVEHDLRVALESKLPILFCHTGKKEILFPTDINEIKSLILEEFDVEITEENKYKLHHKKV